MVVFVMLSTPLCGDDPRGWGLCIIPRVVVLAALHLRKRYDLRGPRDQVDFRQVTLHLLVLLSLIVAIPAALEHRLHATREACLEIFVLAAMSLAISKTLFI